MMKRLIFLASALFPLEAWAQTCPAGQTGPKCKDGSALKSTMPPCTGGKPQCCTGAVCEDAPAPSGGGTGGAGPGGTAECKNPSCPSPPCKVATYGDIGCTTVSGTEAYNHELMKKGDTIASNTHIFGPFEAGFTAQQKSIIEGWGCTDATVAYDSAGGLDVGIAQQKVAHACNIELPRTVGDKYIGFVGPCGGHTKDYHFHRSFSCLYKETGTHSTAVGDIGPWKLYGMWEDYEAKKKPLLDACGGHFGPTPDSNGKSVYHFHVQDKAPFSAGCIGPTADNKLVSVAACRALYPTECGATPEDITIGAGKKRSYARKCPCFDANGMNTGAIKELAALSTSNISYSATTSGATTGGSTTGDTSTTSGSTSSGSSATSGSTSSGSSATSGSTTGTSTGKSPSTATGATTDTASDAQVAVLSVGVVLLASQVLFN